MNGIHVASVLLIACLLPDRPATAQQDPSANVLEEVIVTARRREEALLRVPDQITVFDEQKIEHAQINLFQDFANLTPNLQAFENTRRGIFNITMRGITTVQGGEPPITMLVDGVQVSALEFVNVDLFDLERIQVLRGPQGAMYGRGAIAGVILIDTRQPGNEFEGHVDGVFTTEIDEKRFTGVVSGPIVEDKLLYRLSGSHVNRDGFLNNSLLDTTCDFIEETTLRGRLKYVPTANVTVEGSLSYVNADNYAACITQTTAADPFLGNGDNFPDDLPRDFRQFDDRELIQAAFKLDWKLPGATLTAVTSFQDSDSFTLGDVDFGPAPVPIMFTNPVLSEAWNQDIHFVSVGDERFDWTLGAFYQYREIENRLRVFSVPPAPTGVLLDNDQEDISTGWAAYALGTWELQDNLELAIAARYDSDKRESEDRNVAGSFIDKTYTEFQPKASLTYYWNEELMSYISIGRGFRSGGFNSLADTLAVGLTDREFDEETSTNYEIGFKTAFADGKFSLSGALFRIDFDNQQFFFIDVSNTARFILSFPETRIDGAELELMARPTERFELGASLGIADGEIRDADGMGGLSGNDSPNAHKYTFNLNGQYSVPLTGRLDLRARLQYERRGKIAYDQFNQFEFPETDFVDAFLYLEASDWTIGAFIRNATDERMPTVFAPDALMPGVNALLQNLPRRAGLELRWRF